MQPTAKMSLKCCLMKAGRIEAGEEKLQILFLLFFVKDKDLETEPGYCATTLLSLNNPFDNRPLI